MEEAKMDKPVQCDLNSEVHAHLCWSPFWLLAEMTFFFVTVDVYMGAHTCLSGNRKQHFPERIPGHLGLSLLPRQKVRASYIERMDNKVLPYSIFNSL